MPLSLEEQQLLLHLCMSVASAGGLEAYNRTREPDLTRVEKSGDELSLVNVDAAVQREMANHLIEITKGKFKITVRGEDIQPIAIEGAKLTAWLDCPDGTQNSVTFHRDFVSLVSVFDQDGPLLVVSYVPWKIPALAYTAIRGQGATLYQYTEATKTENRLTLPLTERYKNFPIILTDWAWLPEKQFSTTKFMQSLVGERLSFRMYGSAGYEAGLVAEGKAAAMFHTDLKIWEFAITLLISEAGGKVWSKQVGDDSYAVVASMDHTLHDKLVAKFKPLV